MVCGGIPACKDMSSVPDQRKIASLVWDHSLSGSNVMTSCAKRNRHEKSEKGDVRDRSLGLVW